MRCKGICIDDRQCKRKSSQNFCSIHDKSIVCEICKKHRGIHDRKRISECGHVFCNECLCKNVMNVQWHPQFSTDSKLECPECKINLEDESWESVTNFLVERNLLKKRIIYKTYLCHELYLKLKPSIELNHEYTYQETDTIHRSHNRKIATWTNRSKILNEEFVDIIYFEKINPGDWRIGRSGEQKIYNFFLGDPEIKKLFPAFQKELVEYIFHPSRITLEMLDS